MRYKKYQPAVVFILGYYQSDWELSLVQENYTKDYKRTNLSNAKGQNWPLEFWSGHPYGVEDENLPTVLRTLGKISK